MNFADLSELIVSFVRDNAAWSLPLMFVLAFGESIAFISLILPFWGILVAVGAIAGASGVSLVNLWIASSLGAAFGDWVSYWLGYHYHEQIARMWPLNKRPDLIPKAHAFFEKWGIAAIFIGRFFGPLRAGVPLAAGIAEMPRVPFQIANFASAFVWSGVLLFLPGGVIELFRNVLPADTLEWLKSLF